MSRGRDDRSRPRSTPARCWGTWRRRSPRRAASAGRRRRRPAGLLFAQVVTHAHGLRTAKGLAVLHPQCVRRRRVPRARHLRCARPHRFGDQAAGVGSDDRPARRRAVLAVRGHRRQPGVDPRGLRPQPATPRAGCAHRPRARRRGEGLLGQRGPRPDVALGPPLGPSQRWHVLRRDQLVRGSRQAPDGGNPRDLPGRPRPGRRRRTVPPPPGRASDRGHRRRSRHGTDDGPSAAAEPATSNVPSSRGRPRRPPEVLQL